MCYRLEIGNSRSKHRMKYSWVANVKNMTFCYIIGLLALSLSPAKHVIASDPPDSQNSFVLKGWCFDIRSAAGVKLKGYYISNKGEVFLGNTNDMGKFEFKIPSNAKALLLKPDHYESKSIPINFPPEIPDKAVFSLSIPFIKADSQAVVTSPGTKLEKADIHNNGYRYDISVIDADNNRPVAVRLCVTCEDKTRKYTLVDTLTNFFPVTLNSTDVCRVEIGASENLADRYSAYRSEPLNQIARLHHNKVEFRLVREMNLLLFNSDLLDDLELRGEITSLNPNHGTHSSGLLIKRASNFTHRYMLPDRYQIEAKSTDEKHIYSRRIEVKEGLNFAQPMAKAVGGRGEVNAHLVSLKPNPTDSSIANTVQRVSESKPVHFDNSVLYFEEGSYSLRDQSKSILDSIVQLVKQYPEVKLNVAGHTNNVGSRDKNMVLSEYRVRTVVNYLSRKGVSDKHVNSQWYGPDQPSSNDKSTQGQNLNQRVEIKFVFD